MIFNLTVIRRIMRQLPIMCVSRKSVWKLSVLYSAHKKRARPILECTQKQVWLSHSSFQKGRIEMIIKKKIDRCVTFFRDSIYNYYFLEKVTITQISEI